MPGKQLNIYASKILPMHNLLGGSKPSSRDFSGELTSTPRELLHPILFVLEEFPGGISAIPHSENPLPSTIPKKGSDK